MNKEGEITSKDLSKGGLEGFQWTWQPRDYQQLQRESQYCRKKTGGLQWAKFKNTETCIS